MIKIQKIPSFIFSSWNSQCYVWEYWTREGSCKTQKGEYAAEFCTPSLPGWARRSEHRSDNQNAGMKPRHLGKCLCPSADTRPLVRGADYLQMVLFLKPSCKNDRSRLPGKPACPSQALPKLFLCSWPRRVCSSWNQHSQYQIIASLAWLWNDRCTLWYQTWKYEMWLLLPKGCFLKVVTLGGCTFI